ncbi:MAG: hypothetical protein M1818_003825 [Claussenomyces sp. TS43310]|nr:MAG: hypothetical protein M1818_003825 [Claussenomyces sp. TS43310]
MFNRVIVLASLIAFAAAVPAPQNAAAAPSSSVASSVVSSSTSATSSASAAATSTQSYSPLSYSYNQAYVTDSSMLAEVTSVAQLPAASIPGADQPAAPVISSQVTGITSHGPFNGTATVTGAVSNSPNGTNIPSLPPNPTAMLYDPNGELNEQEPIPYQPAGGLGTNGTEPVYRVQSDFDYQSILLGLYQEWIELDLFHNILASFSTEQFIAEGLTESDMFLIEFMADQEVGHATLLSNLLGGPGGATPQCTYNYPFTTVREAFDFTQKLTRFGESGVWGFQSHLNAREVAQLLDQSIATEARQQMIFRQFAGLFPMPVWFETGIPQSWAWTLLAPYISSCPANAKRLAWQNFPALTVLNQPNSARINATQTGMNETSGFGPALPASDASAKSAGDYCVGNNVTGADCSAAISQNRSIPLSYPGRKVFLEWENPGQLVGPNNSYVTDSKAGTPEFVVWVTQLNVTYSPLLNVSLSNGSNYGMTIQPDVATYEGDPAINGTMFIALTDANITYTAFNLSMINPHVVAGPFLYQAG